MDNSAKFREFFEKRGFPVLEHSKFDAHPVEKRLLKQLKQRADFFIEQLRPIPGGKMPEVCFDFLDKSRLEAWAGFSEIGMIGMTWGMVFLHYDVYYRMLSHPQVFPGIGDTHWESIKPELNFGIVEDYSENTSPVPAGESRLHMIMPRDYIRRQYAEKLAMLSLDFMIFHEFAHIRNGHCGHLMAAKGTPFLAEISSSGQKLNGMERQALEMDADSSAMLRTWRFHLQSLEHVEAMFFARISGAGPSDPSIDPVEFRAQSIARKSELLRDIITATLVSFSMFNGELTLSKEDDHPPPFFRVYWAIMLLWQNKHFFDPEIADEWDSIASRAFQASADAMTLIGHTNIHPNNAEMIAKFAFADSSVSAHLNEMKQAWTKIRPELLKHCFAVDLAP